jgi:rubrerythrin
MTKRTVTVKRWVCDACGGVWFNAPAGVCPSCRGPGKERDVEVAADGTVKTDA